MLLQFCDLKTNYSDLILGIYLEDSVYVGFGIIVQVKRLSDVIASFISRDITVFTKG